MQIWQTVGRKVFCPRPSSKLVFFLSLYNMSPNFKNQWHIGTRRPPSEPKKSLKFSIVGGDTHIVLFLAAESSLLCIVKILPLLAVMKFQTLNPPPNGQCVVFDSDSRDFVGHIIKLLPTQGRILALFYHHISC